MTPAAPSRVEDSLAKNKPWIFLSPHLDDAVLSCGALIEAVAGTRDVVVATIFTESDVEPHTRAARSFLRQCSNHRADSLFAARRQEDADVLEAVGVRYLHLGETDALFRRRERLLSGAAALGRLIPEVVHRYPSYRFDIALGRISRGDRSLISQLRAKVAGLMELHGAELLFCPVGVGRHVDHLITRMMGESFPDQAVYYSDFPYDQQQGPDPAFLKKHALKRWLWEDQLVGKQRWVRQYATQADALFPDGHIPVAPEIYYVPA